MSVGSGIAACTAPEWSASTVYTGGDTVFYGGSQYTAAYWNLNAEPDANSGPAGSGQPWRSAVACSTTLDDAGTAVTDDGGDAEALDAEPLDAGDAAVLEGGDATLLDAGSDAADSSADAMPSTDASLGSGAWRPATRPSFGADTALLLTDGTVMVHASSDVAWWRLTPDPSGSYGSGTWSQLASMPAGYAPLYFASAVLPDGRVLVEGGEYLEGQPAETALGAIYDPVANTWTAVAPPAGWDAIGDAPSVVLPNGSFMLGSSESAIQALFDPATLTWSPTGSGKADNDSEEGWSLLPSGKVLTIDTTNGTQSELYDPSTGGWSLAGNTGTPLVDATSEEIGPAVLLPNGTLFAIGATSHTALYSPSGAWTPGPDFVLPGGGTVDIADGPATLLPNGHVLCAASPGVYRSPTYFFEFDGASLTQVASTPNAPNIPSYAARLLLLPTGEALATDGSSDVEIYTPTGGPDPSWAPSVTSVPTSLARGSTYTLHGTQLNGLSQAVAYGDDAQAATNYPLVRITNGSSGHVFYARTHGHSTMAVATGATDVSTSFDVPATAETGPSQLVVVANGIASPPAAVAVQ